MQLLDKKFSGLMLATVMTVVLAGCSTTPSTTEEVSAPVEESVVEESTIEETTVDSTLQDGEVAGEVKIIEVEAGSFYYEPNEIRVKQGETVKIVMTSVDMMHDFNIDELGVTIPVTKNGETAEVEFTADTVGEFEFYCSVGQHRANGQVGTLIVEE